MPAAIAIPAIAGVAGAGISAGASIYAGKRAAKGSEQAARMEQEGLDKQLQLERENEQRRREEFDRVEAEKKRQYDAEQAQIAAQYNAEQARREPYRQLSRTALAQLAQKIGLPVPQFSDVPALPATGWTAGSDGPVSTTMPVSSIDPTTLAMLAKRGVRAPMTPALEAPPLYTTMPISTLSRRASL